jgi:hypothetical protein
VSLPINYQDATTPTGALTEFPASTSRGINAINTQINANTSAIAAKHNWFVGHGAPVTISGSQSGDFYLDMDTGNFYQHA